MRKIVLTLSSLTLVISLSFPSCSYRNTEEILGAVCDTSNTKYSTYVKNIITTRCNSESGCHGVDAGSISLETYADVTASGIPDDILTRIKSGNMPKGSSKLDDCTIYKIENWMSTGAQNN